MTPKQIKTWRTDRGLSQTAAAELVGAGSYRTWQDWEAGRHKIPRWLPKMIKLLDNQKTDPTI